MCVRYHDGNLSSPDRNTSTNPKMWTTLSAGQIRSRPRPAAVLGWGSRATRHAAGASSGDSIRTRERNLGVGKTIMGAWSRWPRRHVGMGCPRVTVATGGPAPCPGGPDMTSMTSRFTELAIDCADPNGLARFWCSVLDYEVQDQDDGIVTIGSPMAPEGKHRLGPVPPTLTFARARGQDRQQQAPPRPQPNRQRARRRGPSPARPGCSTRRRRPNRRRGLGRPCRPKGDGSQRSIS